jgi:hypothetical protein
MADDAGSAGGVAAEAVVAVVSGGGWMVYLTQLPLAVYFLASLQDTPLDLAVQRLCTCYGLPLALLVAFSYSPLYGVAACALLWYAFTEAVPFAAIRLPSGVLRQSIFSIVRQTRGAAADAQEAPDANLFAVSVYVKMVQPIVAVINRVGDALSCVCTHAYPAGERA